MNLTEPEPKPKQYLSGSMPWFGVLQIVITVPLLLALSFSCWASNGVVMSANFESLS